MQIDIHTQPSPPRMRFGYQWLVLLVIVLAMMASAGFRWSIGGFLPAWQTSLHRNIAWVSLVASLTLLVYGLVQPWVGRALSRFGVRRVLLSGCGLIGIGLLLTSQAQTLWEVAGGYGLITAVGYAGMANVAATAAVVEWFPRRRGLAIGICNAGNSLGMLTIGPLSLLLIQSLGWRMTALLFAGIILFVLLPLMAWLVRSPHKGEGAPPIDRDRPALSLRRLASDRNFWRLLATFFICGYTTNGLMGPHLVGFLENEGIAVGLTAMALGAMGGFDVLGTLISGHLSDKISRSGLLTVIYLVRAFLLVGFLILRSPAAVIVLAALYGLIDYATVPPTSSLSVDLFGRKTGVMAFSWVTMAHQMGAALSSAVAGLFVHLTGNYDAVFGLAAVLLLGASRSAAKMGGAGSLSDLPTAG